MRPLQSVVAAVLDVIVLSHVVATQCPVQKRIECWASPYSTEILIFEGHACFFL